MVVGRLDGNRKIRIMIIERGVEYISKIRHEEGKMTADSTDETRTRKAYLFNVWR